MKKLLFFVLTVSLLLSNTAMAESIAGKFGVTVRGGASYIADSELNAEAANFLGANKDIEADTGWTIGGGFMYGITDNLAVTFDVNYLQTELEVSEAGGSGRATFGTLQTVDFAFGAQWRFTPQSRFVPYVGAGVDVMWNNVDVDSEFEDIVGGDVNLDVDYTFGAHLSAGVDYFITPNIALNAEIRGLLSTKGDITADEDDDDAVAEYNPSNISGFVGIRFFFP